MPVPPFLPPQLPWVFEILCGQQWPQADEDKLRECAQAWKVATTELMAIAVRADAAAERVGHSVQSISSEQFGQFGSQFTSSAASAVGEMAKQCHGLELLLGQEADQVEFAKLSIDIQIVVLAIQLAWDIALAFATAGGSMAQGAVATMFGRLTVRKILFELLKGAIMAAAPDFITQMIMIAQGHRKSWDVGETMHAAEAGALGAAVGMGVGRLTGGLAGSLTKGLVGDAADTVGAKLTQAAIHTTNAAVTGALTNMGATALTDVMSGQSLDNVLTAGISGAGTGVLFHGAHMAGGALGGGSHPTPVPDVTATPDALRPSFTTQDGTRLQSLPLQDGSYALFDTNGNQHGLATFDPASGRLDVRPITGDPYSTVATVDRTPFASDGSTPVPDRGSQTYPDPRAVATSDPRGVTDPQVDPSRAVPDPAGLPDPRAAVPDPRMASDPLGLSDPRAVVPDPRSVGQPQASPYDVPPIDPRLTIRSADPLAGVPATEPMPGDVGTVRLSDYTGSTGTGAATVDPALVDPTARPGGIPAGDATRTFPPPDAGQYPGRNTIFDALHRDPVSPADQFASLGRSAQLPEPTLEGAQARFGREVIDYSTTPPTRRVDNFSFQVSDQGCDNPVEEAARRFLNSRLDPKEAQYLALREAQNRGTPGATPDMLRVEYDRRGRVVSRIVRVDIFSPEPRSFDDYYRGNKNEYVRAVSDAIYGTVNEKQSRQANEVVVDLSKVDPHYRQDVMNAVNRSILEVRRNGGMGNLDSLHYVVPGQGHSGLYEHFPVPHDRALGGILAGSLQPAHLGEPVVLSADHLLFHVAGADNTVTEVHLQRSGGSWVLHDGGSDAGLMLQRAGRLNSVGTLDIVSHATEDGFVVGDKIVPFRDVLDRIPGAARSTEPLRLLACNAGAGDAVRSLAAETHRVVYAADSVVWLTDAGEAVASNPVDPERNWYPKRPPDGHWNAYHPDGSVTELARDDPHLPRTPEGWGPRHSQDVAPEVELGHQGVPSEHHGGPPEFLDLAIKTREPVGQVSPISPTRFDTEAADLVRRLTPTNAHLTYGRTVEELWRELPAGTQGPYRAELADLWPDLAKLGFGSEGDLQRIFGVGLPGSSSPQNFRRTVNNALDEAALLSANWDIAADPVAAQRIWGPAVASVIEPDPIISGPEPGVSGVESHFEWAADQLDEAHSVLGMPLARGMREWTRWGDIPIYLNAGPGDPMTAARQGNFHVAVVGGGTYDEMVRTYQNMRGSRFSDHEFAQALWNLSTAGDEAQRAALVGSHPTSTDHEVRPSDLMQHVAQKIDPNFQIGTSKWSTRGGRVAKFGAALAYIIGPVEIGRNPEALTNLMNLDLASQGLVPMESVIKDLNTMSPVNAASMVRAKASFDHVMTVTELENAISPSDLSGMSRSDAAAMVFNYMATEERALAQYAVAATLDPRFAGPYAGELQSYVAGAPDQATGVRLLVEQHPDLLVRILLYRLGTVRYA
jgi:hypothetical protein